MLRAGALLLLLQVVTHHQASLPTNADLVMTGAAERLDEVLGLDFEVVQPNMFQDIALMKERLVELMPYLEEAERPVITTAYANLLDLEGTLKVNFGTTLGLLTDKAIKYSQEMTDKIEKYPGKFRSSLRTLKIFLNLVSNNMDDLVEVSDNALRQAKTVLVSVEAFRNMMKVAEPQNTRAQSFKSFLPLIDITETIALEANSDSSFREVISLVETLIPKVVKFGAGFYQIQETPNLKMKVEETIKNNRKVVEEIRKISSELRNAKENIKKSSVAVDDLKESTENYNIEDMDLYLLLEKFGAILSGGKKLGRTVTFATGYKPNVLEIPPTTTTTRAPSTTNTTTTTRAPTTTTIT